MWLHEALLGKQNTVEFLRGATYEEWGCPNCASVNVGYGGPAATKCGGCGRARPEPKTLGVVTKVDHERKTITVTGI